MSFVDSFHSVVVQITDPQRGIYQQVRTRVTKHPSETEADLLARIIVLAHAWEPELTFSQGIFSPQQPTLWRKNVVGDIEIWIQVGEIDGKKLKRAVGLYPAPKCSVYFLQEEQLHKFCHDMRGSKQNWVAGVNFFLLNEEELEPLVLDLASKLYFEVTILDDHLYIRREDIEVSTKLTSIDIWAAYQNSIANGGVAK